MNVITRSMFGQGITGEQLEAVARLVPDILSYLNTRAFTPFVPDWVPLPVDYKYERNYAELKELVQSLIDSRRQQLGSDLISMLLNSVDDETAEQMNDDQLFDEGMTIFAAGFETTATTLTWLWHILEQHPEVTDRIRDEVDSVLGRRTPNVTDIPNLTYIKMVISECLRMFPPIPLLPRTSIDEDYIGMNRLPANATILLFYYGLHHNPQVWDAPDEFRPSRFNPDTVSRQTKSAWLPFSAGPRKCLGDEFAMMEAILATAMITQRFEVTVTGKGAHSLMSNATNVNRQDWTRIVQVVASGQRPCWDEHGGSSPTTGRPGPGEPVCRPPDSGASPGIPDERSG